MDSDGHFKFDNSYARELEGLYVPWNGAIAPAPAVLWYNAELAAELSLGAVDFGSFEAASILSGGLSPDGASPLAQAYAGHQFGGFSPQLGDGRALLVGEILDRNGQRRDIHLKGSGRTPFSRGGDGKAALGPVLREVLIAEAMHALSIPTTRALAAVATGEDIVRDGIRPGAVLARVAASHIRVGTFQFFAARGEHEKLKRLADYAIARHMPELTARDNPYLALLTAVIDRQAALIAKWMGVGFVHGVMNTDNMTISGETIDYGPCAFIDAYDPGAVFSSIDHGGRYAFNNQPAILQWNLARFAETLLDLIAPGDHDAAVRLATKEINLVPEKFHACWLAEMRGKFGLVTAADDDETLIVGILGWLAAGRVDYTGFFRTLTDAVSVGKPPWFEHWQARVGEGADRTAAARLMQQRNPIYIPRNHKVEEALRAAVKQNDLAPFRQLLNLVTQPYRHVPSMEEFEGPAPEGSAPCVTYCGT